MTIALMRGIGLANENLRVFLMNQQFFTFFWHFHVTGAIFPGHEY
jgi:hypothetical protein